MNGRERLMDMNRVQVSRLQFKQEEREEKDEESQGPVRVELNR
jgi:hypothetical protein